MKYKTIDDFSLKGRRVLLRSDLNSPVKDGKVLMNERISESARTIEELKKKGARVVVLAHQANPGEKDFMSLKQHAKLLNKYTKIKFVKNILERKAISKIEALKNGQAILLENIRFLKEEFKPSTKNKIVDELKSLFDIYINDAFSVSHRNHTSIVSFPRVLDSGIGRLTEKELNSLEKLNMRNTLLILGGAKFHDNIKLVKKGRKILSCGLFSQICLITLGKNFGAQNKFLENKLKEAGKNKPLLKYMKYPKDFAVSIKGKRKELRIDEFPSEYLAYDIGKETINSYVREIKKAKIIFMKGTAGHCEDKKFCKGTEELLKSIANSKAYSVVGGGHLSTALNNLKIPKEKFNHVSLSGGALVRFLAGEKLIGLEVLKRK